MDDKTFEQRMAILTLAVELGGFNSFDPTKPHEDRIEEFFKVADRIEQFLTVNSRPRPNSEEAKRKAFLASMDSSNPSCGCGGNCPDC